MRELAPGIHSWARFSEEKRLDFNGLYLELAGGPLLVDPPPLGDDDAAEIERRGRPREIILTNKDHRRAAPAARERFGAPIAIHALDAPLIDCAIDRTFADGERLGGALEVMRVPDGKSPGESALWWAERRVLILGDALLGKPPGELSLVPAEKLADPARARAGVTRLAELEPEVVLVGDGVSLLAEGAAAIRRFLVRA
jgi:glyoxylase-like metal-dependent hydrolase (beta-lactamase superfamily II)